MTFWMVVTFIAILVVGVFILWILNEDMDNRL